jgi:hypothetical protein
MEIFSIYDASGNKVKGCQSYSQALLYVERNKKNRVLIIK